MKKILLVIQFTVILCTASSYASSQSIALLICDQNLQILNVKEGTLIEIKSNVNVIQFYVVDTTVYLVGYTGMKRKDFHKYEHLKTHMWSMPISQVLENKTIDTLQITLESETKSNEIIASSSALKNISSAWLDVHTEYSLKFFIDKKLDSMSVRKDPKYIGKKYAHLKPIISIQTVSNIYQGKCMLNVYMFLENNKKDKDTRTHTIDNYIFICDLKHKKILRYFPIPMKLIEKITIVR